MPTLLCYEKAEAYLGPCLTPLIRGFFAKIIKMFEGVLDTSPYGLTCYSKRKQNRINWKIRSRMFHVDGFAFVDENYLIMSQNVKLILDAEGTWIEEVNIWKNLVEV